jgi:hypothetical protein
VVRRVVARFTSVTGALAAGFALVLSATPAGAQAKPKPPPAPTAIQITGKGISGKLVVQKETRAALFQTLLSEVSWLANATPQTSAPNARALGPKYTVTVLAKNAPQQIYDLYPSAAGGPRAHRLARQPTGKKVDGWFYGRLTMSESLRLSGAPLKAKQDVVTGGIGGGTAEDADVAALDPVASVDEILDQMRRLFLLNGAVLVVILFGLAGTAFLIRRRV